MSQDEKVRSSVDAARDTALPVLPTVNPDAPAPKPNAPASFHPAVYVAYVGSSPASQQHLLTPRRTWITLSSSTIVFNKYILDTAKFRTSQPSSPSPRRGANSARRIPHLPHNMASDLCDHHDANPRSLHNHPRFEKEGAYDGQGLPEGDRANWPLLQFELDLR